MLSNHVPRPLTRRSLLKSSALILSAAILDRLPQALRAESTPALRIGLVTDIHYADRPHAGNRYYRESVAKLREGIDQFRTSSVHFTVELGDLIDEGATLEAEIGHLQTMEKEYARAGVERHYVLGNHCVWTLTKEQFYANCAARKSPYSFDRNGFHFVILDACFRQDGVAYGVRNFKWTDTEIPPAQREWLRADLKSTSLPTVVFVHQRLDVHGSYGIKSAPEVRSILEQSGRVLAVFQGHNHVNDHKELNGIHYCTLAAVIEGSGPAHNAYAFLDVFPDRSLKVTGFHQQAHYDLAPSASTSHAAPGQ